MLPSERETPSAPPAEILHRALRLALPVLLAILSGWLLLHWLEAAPLNADEGFYLAASEAALRGELPYLNFGYTQMPLLPLLNAPLLALAGMDLTGLRASSVLWTLLSLAAAYLLMGGKQRPLQATLGLAALLLCPSLLAFLSIGKTYAASQAFLLLASSALVLPGRPIPRLLWLSVFGTLAVGTRSTCAPAILILWLGFLALNHRACGWRPLLLIPLATAALLVGPFVALAPDSFWFWNWEFHRAAERPLHPEGLLTDLWHLSPSLCLATLLSPVLLRASWRSDRSACLILVSAVGALLINLLVFGNYAEYATPYALPVLAGCVRLLSTAFPKRPSWLGGACVALLLGTCLLWAKAPPNEEHQALQSAARASEFLGSHTAPGTPVLASMPELPVAAGRPLLFDLVMGKFGVTDELPAERAAKLGLSTLRELQWAVASRHAGAVVLTKYPRWNFIWTLPSYNSSPLQRQRFLWHLGTNYDLAYQDTLYLVFLPRGKPLETCPDWVLRL